MPSRALSALTNEVERPTILVTNKYSSLGKKYIMFKKVAAIVSISAGVLLGATACGSSELSTSKAAGADRTFEEGWAEVKRGEVYCIFVSNAHSSTTSCDWKTLGPKTGKAIMTLNEAWVKTSKGEVLCIKSTDTDGMVLPDCDWTTLKK